MQKVGMKKLWILSYLLTFCICVQAEPVSSTSPIDLSLHESLAIEVTSVSKQDQPFSKAAAAIYVIIADKIHQPVFSSIPQALRDVP